MLDYIAHTVNKLVAKYRTRNPYEICDALGIHVSLKDLDNKVKAYYCCHSRVRNIVLSHNVSEIDRRILVAHELGHDRLHKKIAPLVGFQETGMFIKSLPTEYEANLFAADLLIDDDELRSFLGDDDKTHSGVAGELGVPIELLDFKFRLMECKGLLR